MKKCISSLKKYQSFLNINKQEISLNNIDFINNNNESEQKSIKLKKIQLNIIDNTIQKFIEDKLTLFHPINQGQNRKRNVGIDIVRIISIYFIINHHILFHGGIFSRTKILSFEFTLLTFFNTIFCSGVNMFGMISGFVGFNSHKYSNLIYLLIQTFLYNYGIALYFKKTKPKLVPDLNRYLYPLFITDYWYFNSYFIMYFLLPFINAGIKSIGKRQMGQFNLCIFIFFCCFNQICHYSIILNRDLFFFRRGFSYIWLTILYILGSYFGRFKDESYKNYNKYIVFILCIAIVCSASFFRNLIIIHKLKKYRTTNGMIIEYTSPSSVIISSCFIIMFCKLDISSTIINKIISFIAPLTYGIYLIHNHVLVRSHIIFNNYSWILKNNCFKLILLQMFESLKIFIYCTFIDYLRSLIFKILRLKAKCIFIASFLNKIGNGIIFIFELLY